MQDIVELERRITAALARIEMGVEELPPAGVANAPVVPEAGRIAAEEGLHPTDDISEAEKPTLLRLREKLADAREREENLRQSYEQKIAALERQLDNLGRELSRMKKTAIALEGELHRLRQAQTERLPQPELLNHVLQVELEALRAVRLSEIVELDELTQALEGHLTEAEQKVRHA